MARLAIFLLAALVLILAAGFAATRIGAARISQRFPPEGRFVEVDGGRMHLLDIPGVMKDAPALLMIHGASGNHAEIPLALAKTLGGRYRILSVDRPGHGWSDRIGGVDAASPARQAALMVEAARKAGAARAIVVAHSLGGAPAMQVALNHPEFTAGLVLIAPATHPWPGGVAAYYTLTDSPVVGALFAETLALPLASMLIDNAVAAVFAPQQPPPDYAARAKIPLLFRPAHFRANAQDVAALKAFVTAAYPRYATLRLPVAIVSGDADAIVSTQIHSAALAREIAGAELTVLPGVGHAPHHHAPQIVAATVDRVAARAGLAPAAP